MPNTYIRKSNRASWSEKSLQEAILAVLQKRLSLRAASKQFKIPEKTLRSRIKNKNFTKGSLGPYSQLGKDAEKKLVKHILDLQASGFVPRRKDAREIAFDMAELLGIKNTFNKKEKRAGKVWLSSFMRRNPELTIRKGGSTSRARTEGMNRKEISDHFELLTKILEQNDLFNKPGNIWNADETMVQMNNSPDETVPRKRSKDSLVLRSTSEKSERILLLVCCNAEGHFLPPYCVTKGENKKPQQGIPPGTVIELMPQSADMNTDLFMNWLLNHFIPRKPAGKNLLILDGHSSHMNNASLLQIARDNGIVLLCLPNHNTHYLQPLDRVVFKHFKICWIDACDKLVGPNKGVQNISMDEFGGLLSTAWNRVATAERGVSAFKVTGIYPLNMYVIPDHIYLLSCDQSETSRLSCSSDVSNETSSSASCTEGDYQLPGSSATLTLTEALKFVCPAPSSNVVPST